MTEPTASADPLGRTLDELLDDHRRTIAMLGRLRDLILDSFQEIRICQCAYCQWTVDVRTDADGTAAMRAHVEKDCPNHPMRGVERERNAYKKAYNELRLVADKTAVHEWNLHP